MNINKTKMPSKLTHQHISDILKLAKTGILKMTPDVDAHVQAKDAQLQGQIQSKTK